MAAQTAGSFAGKLRKGRSKLFAAPPSRPFDTPQTQIITEGWTQSTVVRFPVLTPVFGTVTSLSGDGIAEIDHIPLNNKEVLMYSQTTRQRLFYTLFFTQSLFSAAQFAVGTLVAIVVVRLGGTESVAGLPASTSIFAQALSALPIAIVMGRFGRRLGLSLGYAAGALGGLIGVIAIVQGIFPLLLLSAALLGMARASSDQGRFVAAEMFAESERARMVGRLIFAGTIGAVAGPALVVPSGQLMNSFGLQSDVGPWAAMFVLCVVASLLIFVLLRPDPMVLVQANAASKETKLDKQPESARPLGMLLTLPKVQLAVSAAIISQTVMVVIMVMTPLHMHHHNHGTEAISLVISMHILGMFGAVSSDGLFD